MKFEHELDRLKREEGQRPEESLQPIDDETAIANDANTYTQEAP